MGTPATRKPRSNPLDGATRGGREGREEGEGNCNHGRIMQMSRNGFLETKQLLLVRLAYRFQIFNWTRTEMTLSPLEPFLLLLLLLLLTGFYPILLQLLLSTARDSHRSTYLLADLTATGFRIAIGVHENGILSYRRKRKRGGKGGGKGGGVSGSGASCLLPPRDSALTVSRFPVIRLRIIIIKS